MFWCCANYHLDFILRSCSTEINVLCFLWCERKKLIVREEPYPDNKPFSLLVRRSDKPFILNPFKYFPLCARCFLNISKTYALKKFKSCSN